jgi:septal ring factor EnvC (AmiA/AmiB activator)
VRVEIDATEAEQRKERDALKGDQARIAALIERKAALQQAAQRTADESRKRQQQLAAEAGNLRDLVARADPTGGVAAPPPPRPADKVAVIPPPAPSDPAKPGRPPRPFAQARGALVVPVVGALIGRYGSADPQGGVSRGLTFATRPGAEVVAPYDGRVVFAGPFRGYGQILIIGHGDGYHSLLAGLDRIESSVGQWLMAGEPVGTMAGGVDKPRLYLELRHNNQPINPLPWLTTRVEKVNG